VSLKPVRVARKPNELVSPGATLKPEVNVGVCVGEEVVTVTKPGCNAGAVIEEAWPMAAVSYSPWASVRY